MSLKASEIAPRSSNESGISRSFPRCASTCAFRTSRRCSIRDWEQHGHMERAVELMAEWCRRQPIVGNDVADLAAAGPHAVDIHRGAARANSRRHRIALRPSRQADRNLPAGRGTRALGARAPGRPAVWPRRRRRWLCSVLLAHGDRCAASAECPACALRGADRGVRGERQPGFAGARRGARRRHRHPESRGVPRCGGRRLRAAVAHHLASGKHRRHAAISRCSPKACIRARAAVSRRRASMCCACCSRGCRMRRPASSRLAELNVPRYPPSGAGEMPGDCAASRRFGRRTHAVRARCARDVAGPGGAARELHLETDLDRHRTRRAAEREQRRQRAGPAPQR